MRCVYYKKSKALRILQVLGKFYNVYMYVYIKHLNFLKDNHTYNIENMQSLDAETYVGASVSTEKSQSKQ